MVNSFFLDMFSLRSPLILSCDNRNSISFSSPVNYGIVYSLHAAERGCPRIGVRCSRPPFLLHEFIRVEYDAKAEKILFVVGDVFLADTVIWSQQAVS
jgi:hypothetical protein